MGHLHNFKAGHFSNSGGGLTLINRTLLATWLALEEKFTINEVFRNQLEEKFSNAILLTVGKQLVNHLKGSYMLVIELVFHVT